MPRLKIGEWYTRGTEPAMLLVGKWYTRGDFRFAVRTADGFEPFRFNEEYRAELKPAKRLRWLAFKAEVRPISEHTFKAFHAPNGRGAVIVAGCRVFSIAQAKEHWTNHCGRPYPVEVTAQINAWSLAYVTKLERHLRKVRIGKAS